MTIDLQIDRLKEIRQKSGLDTDGSTLVGDAFGYKKGTLPRLAWSSLQTETDRSEHRGPTNLCRCIRDSRSASTASLAI